MKVRKVLLGFGLSLLFVFLGLGASSSSASARTIHAFPSYIRGYWHTGSESHGVHITKHTMTIDGSTKFTHPRYKPSSYAAQDVRIYNTPKHHWKTISFVTEGGHKLSYAYDAWTSNPWILHYGW